MRCKMNAMVGFIPPAVRRFFLRIRVGGVCALLLLLFSLGGIADPAAQPATQQSNAPQQNNIVLEGTVRDTTGNPVAGALVFLEEKGGARLVKTATNPDGTFAFTLAKPGTYAVRAEKDSLRSVTKPPLVLKLGEKQNCDLTLAAESDSQDTSKPSPQSSAGSLGAIQLADEPNFTVAGVTDWSNAGLHGSDARARTSDELAKETLALKSAPAETSATAPPNADYVLAEQYRSKGDFARAREAARKSLAAADTSATHRLLGDLNERLGDPLQAVHEFELAAHMDPSEQSYLEWGAELLLHKAPQPAAQVFEKGSNAHPESAKMLAGLGAALYAAGSFEEAALRLCAASDLNPADPAPYLFLGEMEKSAPAALPCAQEKLARFAKLQPENPRANYYYAMTLWKQERGQEAQSNRSRAEALLEKAIKADPNFAEAYVQLGVLYATRGDFQIAIENYKKAIAANPLLSDAHYQLSLAYKRTGGETKAHQEFEVYQQTQKAETAAADRQRHELRQFMIILKDPSPSTPTPPTPSPSTPH
jgi:tetratricopeptide (TPR) repeat protein